MRTILKWELKKQVTVLNLGKDSEILTVQEQHGAVQLWTRVAWFLSREDCERTFVMRPDNGIIPDDVNENYIGTVQRDGVAIHVFERITPRKEDTQGV